MNIPELLAGYNLENPTIAVLGGHSALDICGAASRQGLRTLVVAKKGREKTYTQYFKRQNNKGCIHDVIVVDEFKDVLQKKMQQQLRSMSTIFVHNRYFWVYFNDFSKVENDFKIPIYGSRTLLKLEERDQPFNQYDLLKKAGIRTPKIFKNAKDIDRPVLVKAAEAKRKYERAFFIATDTKSYEEIGSQMQKEGKIGKDWRKATIEEFIVGAPVNFNFFYSPMTKTLELLGTDMRRQTNLDGFLRMTADQQLLALKHVPLKMIETGHVACTVKESLLEKAFELGEKFVKATQSLPKKLDPSGKGIIGPFALQGAVVAEEGREDIVIFDVSLRMPGSPGTAATPYTGYYHGWNMSVGQRVSLELYEAIAAGRLQEILT